MNYPVGKSDFGKIVLSGDSFVDKTLFAKELIDRGAEVTLITRPRRFGKTSNLSMLQHFLSDEVFGNKTEGLFDGLHIDQAEGAYVQNHQGKYPVIFLTMKGVKTHTFTEAREAFTRVVSKQYEQHAYLLDSERLLDAQKKMCQRYIMRAVEGNDLADGLTFLSHCLYKHTGKRVWILIDEYDTPLLEAHVNGYWKEMSNFMGQFLTEALKDNHALDRSVMTGITRIARENLFSELNHVDVYTVLDERYSEYFGFTEGEVNRLLNEAEFKLSAEEIKGWYNGYHFGNHLIYNPWSIIKCLSREGRLEPYWVNTSQNALIGKLVKRLPIHIIDRLAGLANRAVIDQELNDTLVMDELEEDPKALWTLMMMTGYLNAQIDPSVFQGRDTLAIPAKLSVPNHEVLLFFKSMIQRWLIGGQDSISRYNPLLDLLNKDFDGFKDKFANLLLNLVSSHDATRFTQEAFYHGLLLGAAAFLPTNQYLIESNKESGQGRFDIALIPKDVTKPGAVIELKAVKEKEQMIEAAQEAYGQIGRLAYTADLQKRRVTDIVQIGIGFCQRDFAIFPST